MRDDLDTLEADLGDHLRHTLRVVADHADVPEAPPLARRRWRRLATTAVAAIVAVGAASAFLAQNEDAIVRIPVEEALMSGQAASGEWWLLPTDAVVDGCAADTGGVVLVAEQINRPGSELNAGGSNYGEPSGSIYSCAPADETSWLADPTRSSIGHSRLGYERDDTPWGVYGAFHPTVEAIRVNTDNESFLVETVARDDRPSGPRYIAFTLPADTSTTELELVDTDGNTITSVIRTFP
ncbi:hypothetical protein [Actinospongicola halichondriae]|uniref:hypothetical protein n=1 Tax=Actinospongicola halichondriae TaxID=3236844 RepID=UPI003D4525F8